MRRVTVDLICNEIYKAIKSKEEIEKQLGRANTSNINQVMTFKRELQQTTNKIFTLQNR